MWNRAMIKLNAKTALKGSYWTAFAVCLIAMIIMSGFSYLSMPFNIVGGMMMGASGDSISAVLSLLRMSGYLFIGNILFMIFVATPIVIGMDRFFIQNHFRVTKLETLFSGFRWGYINSVGAFFVTNLFITLWSFLLLIPGIVKSLQYSMVQFILADNPDMPGSRAREISRMMTDGEKGRIFVFFLSFIGWFLLGSLCLGVGILFVYPYFYASYTELYIFLRDRAIANNMLNPAELNLISPEPTPGV